LARRPIDFEGLRTVELGARPSKVDRNMLGRPVRAGLSLADFLEGLPRVLAAGDLLDAAQRIAAAIKDQRPVILGMGAHPIKVGLGPLICDLLRRGVITALALNGAGVIHDVEMALAGHTSEDVDTALADGSFGMSGDTARFINEAIAAAPEEGLGKAVGAALLAAAPDGVADSLLATAAEKDLTVSVHVALGTDIIHLHPSCDPAATGRASHLDFRRFCAEVADLEGGVYLNLGSAVILPEVFLKALTLVRNLGHRVFDFTTVNLDMIGHYRPLTNVVRRPTLIAGRGINLIGHHEINFPLLMAAGCEALTGQGDDR
jgi:hypothetical protein